MSSFLDRLKARMDKSLGQHAVTKDYQTQEAKPRHRHLVETNRWDRKIYKTSRETALVDDLITDLESGDTHKGGEREAYDAAPELVEGLFHEFYKAAPELTPKRQIERDLYPARKLLEEIQQHPQLKDLQDLTAGDAVLSTVAVDAMGDTVREYLTKIQDMEMPPMPGGGKPGGSGGGKGQGEGGGKGQKGEDTDKKEADEADGGEVEDQQDEDLTGEGDGDFDKDAEDAENQAEADWESQFDEALDGLDIDRLANAAVEAAKAEVTEIEDLRKGIGMEDGEWYSMNPESRLALADQLRTDEMKELAEIIGRMKRFALGVKATKINDVPHEAYDVETGNDLRRVLRAQMALLGNEFTKYEFYRRWTDKELLVYKMRGTEDVGKGPIVIAIDKSGSMSGGPFRWAMAVAEALRRFAAEEDRDYYAMFFGNNNDRERFDFPEGKGPFEKVLAFLGTQANGGTQFDGVLTEALEKASKSFDDGGRSKADIVFITDGMAHLEDAWIKQFNEERNRVGVRVYSVYIGGAYDTRHHDGPLGLLEKISDATIPVAELKPESVREVFARV